MRIIQITDLHVGREGEDTYGVDVRANFLNILREVKKLGADKLVISGDFCYRDPQEGIYDWIRPHLENLRLPYYFISGNHDDPEMLTKAFGREELLDKGELFFKEKWDSWPVLFLDSTTGRVSDVQLAWLEKELAGINRDVVLFIHHPPLVAGVPFMDGKHVLQNKDKIQEILHKFPRRIYIFSGHYHVERLIHKANMSVHITPATFFQISPYHKEFQLDHHRIALRVITLNEDSLMSTVHYFDGTPLELST